jgi:trehalose 6-phosphate synthase/phosphatase
VVVSVFLPVVVRRGPAGGPGGAAGWAADWDYEVLLSMQTHLRVTRVGVVKWRGSDDEGGGGGGGGGIPRGERHLVEECLRPFNCVPVWIDPVLFGHMYNGFCKGVMWPVLHNVTSVYNHKSEDDDVVMSRADGPGGGAAGGGGSGDARPGPGGGAAAAAAQFSEYSMDDIEQGPIHGGRGREAELWSAYNTVNRLFAERVVQCFHEGDLVWIHGFHLLILPSYLTRRIPMAKVGIFLHTPFPSSEIFRTVWCREDLLRGMLNADQVGFHLFEYARHFLTSCRRLLGLNYGMIPDTSGGHTLAIDTNGRSVVVTSIHAGVEPPVLNQILNHATTLDRAQGIRHSYQGRTIFCGIDRLESLKGIPLKLLGMERFLRRRPEWVGKLVLIQVGISAFERGEDYLRTKAETNKLVTKINALWPGTVQFQECAESEMGLQQRMALLKAADVVVVTSIRDGLNLLPLEFTIAHQDAVTASGRSDGRRRGLCILSEFASCTRVMRGALHVNPWKIAEIATAFDHALHMTEEERVRRIGIASEFVTRVTTQRWALAVMLDLKGVYKNLNPATYSGAGLGLNYRLLGMDTGFKSLDTNLVARAYKKSKSRLILVDYGGTIVNNDNVRWPKHHILIDGHSRSDTLLCLFSSTILLGFGWSKRGRPPPSRPLR